MALSWESYKDPDDGYEFVYWRAPGYRIDPEVAWNARSYHPRARVWRVCIATAEQRFSGGEVIGTAYSVREAKAIAEQHAAAKETL